MSKSQNTKHLGNYLILKMQVYLVRILQTIQILYQHIIPRWLKNRNIGSFVSIFLIGTVLSIAIASCSGNSFATKGDVKLKLASFSVTKAAHDQIIPKFVEKWKQEHNQNVTIEATYGGSGAQTAEIISGSQEADIVHLALPLDVIKIQQAGLIKSGWEIKSPRSGIVSRSVAAIVTREGNPKGINSWEDLAKDGVKIIAANPKTSGIAIWEFLAFWGSVTLTGGDEATALDYITKVYKHTPVLTKDAREASDLFFQQNQGDVLINYENEVILAGKNGTKLPYIVPQINISIDNPVTVVDKNVDKHGTRKVAQAFVDFLYSTEAQREFAKLQYRPVNPTVTQEVAAQQPPIQTLFTSQDLGGWELIQKKFFQDGAIFDKVQSANKA
ncbi:sulfate ABC transporter substrate-binding protein [Anabaena catenula]|uniref:Sulfate ABC transporter substrate-binding protein n=1 Tax=Anabaena catenula FACHB-362 TaxID=2692877 RepID=A0ABR8J3E7_9NOST|nr:sulfate ABC transporter substrate-binding protein [Anabaena catenula]MBD2692888.1 sulfate ABC transporter substrate-binding protein [Anabaena catenula FACHB-362]